MNLADTEKYDSPDERHSYRSNLIRWVRDQGHVLRSGRLTVRLAEKLGFCWGVDRAVAMVWDALRDYPGRQIWLLNQIIHNPRVNEDFRRSGVKFVFGKYADTEGFDQVGAGDIAVIPAFSAEVEHVERLRSIGCQIVDTTCPWVEKPHRRVNKYLDDGFTVLIHGIYGHDETRATCSLVESRNGHYLVFRTLEEAEILCSFLRGEIDAASVVDSFEPTSSPGFDPDRHLQLVGMVNQTTMLASESRDAAGRILKAVEQRSGEFTSEQFRDFDTICPATQDNQDAVIRLSSEHQPDVFLVLGGYDSSNTANLVRAARPRHGAFHVQSAEALSDREIRHRDPDTAEERVTTDWLPEGPVEVSLSAGASTPDTELERVIAALCEVAGVPLPKWQDEPEAKGIQSKPA